MRRRNYVFGRNGCARDRGRTQGEAAGVHAATFRRGRGHRGRRRQGGAAPGAGHRQGAADPLGPDRADRGTLDSAPASALSGAGFRRRPSGGPRRRRLCLRTGYRQHRTAARFASDLLFCRLPTFVAGNRFAPAGRGSREGGARRHPHVYRVARWSARRRPRSGAGGAAPRWAAARIGRARRESLTIAKTEAALLDNPFARGSIGARFFIDFLIDRSHDATRTRTPRHGGVGAEPRRADWDPAGPDHRAERPAHPGELHRRHRSRAPPPSSAPLRDPASDTESTRAMDSDVLEKALRASRADDTVQNGSPPTQRFAAPPPAVPPDPAVWFAMLQGKQTGPLTRTDLEVRADDGELGPRTYVWCEGMDSWQRAKDVLELAPLFPQ